MCFLLGGITQFFLGLPNTAYTYSVVLLFYFIILLYTYTRGVVMVDRVVISTVLYGSWIFISGAVNGSGAILIAIYTIFFLLPLGCYLFFKINQKNNYISHRHISRLYLIIACIQAPILLMQRFGYSALISFNRSSQQIVHEDFLFGSFFLKADHALGFFLLMNIFNLIENNRSQNITKHAWLFYGLLGGTVFLSESNITKLLLLVFVAYLIFKSFPRKIRIISLVIAILVTPLLMQQAAKIKNVQTQLHFIDTQYNVTKSWENFEKGIAKRPQVIITYARKIPLKWIGDGPYSYFDILKGKFAKTKHFSQMIWTYADLGLIGLFLFLLLLWSLVRSLEISGYLSAIVFGVILIYSLMTTIFSDLAIMISLISLLQKRK